MDDLEQTHVQITECIIAAQYTKHVHSTQHSITSDDFLRLSKDVQDLKALDVDAECSGATNLDSLQGEIVE